MAWLLAVSLTKISSFRSSGISTTATSRSVYWTARTRLPSSRALTASAAFASRLNVPFSRLVDTTSCVADSWVNGSDVGFLRPADRRVEAAVLADLVDRARHHQPRRRRQRVEAGIDDGALELAAGDEDRAAGEHGHRHCHHRRGERRCRPPGGPTSGMARRPWPAASAARSRRDRGRSPAAEVAARRVALGAGGGRCREHAAAADRNDSMRMMVRM